MLLECVDQGCGSEALGCGRLVLKKRRIPPQNVVMRLKRRETHGCDRPGTQSHVSRRFYQNVVPNLTVVNVEKPPCFLRKFSPDGRHLIAFSADQTSLEVYEYRGPSAAEDLLQGLEPGREQVGDDSSEAQELRAKVSLRPDYLLSRVHNHFRNTIHSV